MRAGRELDALVAEKVMGWKQSILSNFPWQLQHPENELVVRSVPHYSTQMGDAWQVAERFINAGCAAWVEGDGHTGYRAGCTTERGRYEEGADSPALAMCLAALKAVGIPTPGEEIDAAIRGG